VVDTALNWPLGQAVQLVAPVDDSVLVTEPAAHATQRVAPAWQNTEESSLVPDQSTPGSVSVFEAKSYVLNLATMYPELLVWFTVEHPAEILLKFWLLTVTDPAIPLAVLIAATAAVHSARLAIGRSPALAHVEPSATAIAPGARESTAKEDVVWLTAAVYCPAGQPMHAAVELTVYVPALQAVQTVAPGAAPVLVMEPAPQLMQAIPELVLYWPAAPAVQLVAPAAVSVSVTDPALQLAHAVVDTALNWPLGQAVQLVAPVDDSVLVTEPAAHATQRLAPAWQNTEFSLDPHQSTPGSVSVFEEKSYVLK
jgi:hypothetical protein